MKNEFEKLAGYEVTTEDYNNIIEPMYMALPNVTKQDFVKMIDRKRFALPTKKQCINEMKKIAAHLFEICGRCRDHEAETELLEKAHAYMKRFYGIDWSKDMQAYCLLMPEYEIPSLQRGCTYFKELILGRGSTEYERIKLV